MAATPIADGLDSWERTVRRTWRTLASAAERTIARIDAVGEPAPGLGAGCAPVLVFGGYANHESAVGAIARSLARDGFDVHTMTIPGHGMGDVREQRLAVRRRVEQVRAATGADRVDLVGYSHGGYVARAAAQFDGGDASIGRVVTLATANAGFDFGRFNAVADRILPLAVRQVRRGSELIEELLATGVHADVVAIGSHGHDLIIPARSGVIEGKRFVAIDEGRRLGPLSRVTHLRVLTDAHAYELLRGVLAGA
ncbi:MAG: lipase LipA precursor [Thermoleophilia bacterium]|nr:lipase LipA precursor [Thermoleophilia bacterium]